MKISQYYYYFEEVCVGTFNVFIFYIVDTSGIHLVNKCIKHLNNKIPNQT